MVSQQRSLKDSDRHGKTAEKLVSLIPSCCFISAADVAVVAEETDALLQTRSVQSRAVFVSWTLRTLEDFVVEKLQNKDTVRVYNSHVSV